jgi:hypothetical protein
MRVSYRRRRRLDPDDLARDATYGAGMTVILAQINQTTWGWWHQLAWGWWLLIVIAAAVLAGLVLYAGFLTAFERSAARGTRPHGDRAEANPQKASQQPPHAAATT